MASLTHISKYSALKQNRMCEGNVILRNALNISDRQDKTYHALCYTSRGALAGTRYSPHGIKWSRKVVYGNIPLFSIEDLIATGDRDVAQR